MAKARNYRFEYDNFQGKPEQVKNRASRNAARRQMEEKHGKAALKGKDVSHKNDQPRDNRPENLMLEKPAINRARKGKK